MNKVSISWTRYTNLLKNKLPEFYQNLNPPCTKELLEQADTVLGFSLPDDLKQLYMLNNGEVGIDYENIFMGLHFMKLETILGLDREFGFQDVVWSNEKEFYSADTPFVCPPNTIRKKLFSKYWIPFLKTGTGEWLGIDTNPDVKGRYGQLINFGWNANGRYVWVDSVADLIDFLYAKLSNSDYEIITFKAENRVIRRLKMSNINSLITESDICSFWGGVNNELNLLGIRN